MWKPPEAHLSPDPLLLIHSHHTITDHVIHQVGGLNVLLQFLAEAQQTAPCPFLQRHFCATHQPYRISMHCTLLEKNTAFNKLWVCPSFLSWHVFLIFPSSGGSVGSLLIRMSVVRSPTLPTCMSKYL